MHTVTIYGASDDLIEVDGDAPGCGEYNAEHGSFIVSNVEGSTRVYIDYDTKGYDGCWAITLGPISEDIPMLPAWLDSREGYTARATFEGVAHVTREHLPEEGDDAR